MPSFVLATLLLAQSPNLSSVIASAARKLDAMATFGVKVDVVTTSGKNSYRSHFDIAVRRPNGLLMRVTEPQQGGKAATDRSYSFQGAKLTAVDFRAREYLKRTVSLAGPMHLRVANALGRMGEAFEIAISGERTKFILTALGEGLRWTRVGDRWQSTGESGAISIVFGNGLLKSVGIVSAEGSTRWTFEYSASPGPLHLNVPKGFKPVESFVERLSEPKYASPQAKKLYQKAFSAYQKLGHVDLVTNFDRGEKVHIRYSGRAAREDWPNYSWAFDGSTLTIVDYYRKVTYRGRARGSQVIEMLANAGCPMHPFTRAAFRRQNWLATFLADDMILDRAGTIVLSGVRYEILAFKALTFKGTMQIDAKSGRVGRVILKHLSLSGSVVGVSDTTYRFKSVGNPIKAAVFKLSSPTGFVTKPVGPLADKIGG